MHVFELVKNNMDELFTNIYEVSNQVYEIDEIRKTTVEAVGNTATVSEEIMASSSMVKETMDTQVELVSELRIVTSSLNTNRDTLNKMMSRYKR